MTTYEQAREAIYAYTYGMDLGNWEYAVTHFAPEVEVDYSQVGAPKGRMSRDELKAFLGNLLGKAGLKVHTAISQVMSNPGNPAEFIAYYSVRHYKGPLGSAQTFFVFGWYNYRMEEDQITHLTIHVQAMEGDPNVLRW